MTNNTKTIGINGQLQLIPPTEKVERGIFPYLSIALTLRNSTGSSAFAANRSQASLSCAGVARRARGLHLVFAATLDINPS